MGKDLDKHVDETGVAAEDATPVPDGHGRDDASSSRPGIPAVIGRVLERVGVNDASQRAPLAIVVGASLLAVLAIALCGEPAVPRADEEALRRNAPVVTKGGGGSAAGGAADEARDDGKDLEYEYAESVLGIYETSAAAADEAARSQNLQVAARALNGTIIQPDDTFSFNAILGEPTPERGYVDVAGAESSAEAIDQVASALHVAALRAGLSVPVRNAHVRAVDYIEPGLDAMVVWGMSDLEVYNGTDAAVTVQATVSGTAVTVSIFGTPGDDAVTHDVTATVVDTYSRLASDVYSDPLAQGLLSSDSVRFTVTETYLDTYRDGELETSELLYADTYQLPGDSTTDEEGE